MEFLDTFLHLDTFPSHPRERLKKPKKVVYILRSTTRDLAEAKQRRIERIAATLYCGLCT